MLLWLTQYFSEYYSAFGALQYLTFRSMATALTALGVSLLIGSVFIKRLSHHQLGQHVREDGRASHFSIAGTPTMGGVLILVAILLTVLLWTDLTNRLVWVALAVTMSFGVAGWLDDYLKISGKNSKGQPVRWKYFWQSVVGGFAVVFLYVTAQTPAETTLIGPFLKEVAIFLGGSYVALPHLTIVGMSSAVNLTDGLDGLAISPTVMVAGALGVVAIMVRHEIVLLIMGGGFVVETASVILQVASFRLTGKRIFRMAPIDHHFELKCWPEPKVDVRFRIVALIFVLTGLSRSNLR